MSVMPSISFSKRCENCRLYYPADSRAHCIAGGGSCVDWSEIKSSGKECCGKFSMLKEKTYLVSPHYGIKLYVDDEQNIFALDFMDMSTSPIVIQRFREKRVKTCLNHFFQRISATRDFLAARLAEITNVIPKCKKKKIFGVSAIENDNVVTDKSPARNRMNIFFGVFPKNVQLNFALMDDGRKTTIPVRFSFKKSSCMILSGNEFVTIEEYAKNSFGWMKLSFISDEIQEYVKFADAVLAMQNIIQP